MTASGHLGAQAVIAFDIRLRFSAQYQCLWCVDLGPVGRLAIDQPVQQVQHMGLGWHPCGQGQFHGSQHGLFIVMQDEGKDIDHFPVTAGSAQHLILELAEGGGHLDEWGTVAQRTGFALDHRQIMPPIIDRARRQIV